jgi:hypothetical protein
MKWLVGTTMLAFIVITVLIIIWNVTLLGS